jgi:hypothetical protein
VPSHGKPVRNADAETNVLPKPTPLLSQCSNSVAHAIGVLLTWLPAPTSTQPIDQSSTPVHGNDISYAGAPKLLVTTLWHSPG